MPRSRKRTCFRLSISDDCRYNQFGVVEGRAASVREYVAEFAPFMDRAWGLGSAVAADASRKRELLEELLQPDLVFAGRMNDISWLGRLGYDLVPLPKFWINLAFRAAGIPRPSAWNAMAWYDKGEFDRAIADGTEAIQLAQNPPPDVMTPPGSVQILALTDRGLAYEAKGDAEHARADFAAALKITASDAGSKANQDTARVRLSLLSDPAPTPSPSPRNPSTSPADQPSAKPAAP